jgi:hypothetical protein
LDKSLYYDPNKLLSYNRILNFVIGARGIGKSYGWKVHPIRRFLKHGKQFIYVRRYKPELKKVPFYFDDVKQEFPGVEFKVKGRELFINGKIAGWAIPLSTWQSEKSNAYPNVETIIFDEFIREKDNSGYIPNEVPALLNLMDTVFRSREDVKCVCLSNAVSVVNPYFLYFDLVPNIKKRFNAYKSIVIEIPDSKDFSEQRRKTKFGSLIDGTEYGDMSLDNEFVNDSSVFIERRSKESKHSFSVIYKGMTMGVWVDVEQGVLFLSHDHDPSSKLVFALSAEDLSENALMMVGWKNNYYLKKMVGAFMNGYLRFDNQVLRNTGYEMFKKMNVQ